MMPEEENRALQKCHKFDKPIVEFNFVMKCARELKLDLLKGKLNVKQDNVKAIYDSMFT
ncbi:MAG: hypothetical protein ACP5OH_03985 [Nitrososphaerota archaeon]